LIKKTFGTGRIEPVDPVAQRLTVHAADPRSIGPAHPVQNRRDRQQPAALAHILRCSRQPAKLAGRIVTPQLHR